MMVSTRPEYGPFFVRVNADECRQEALRRVDTGPDLTAKFSDVDVESRASYRNSPMPPPRVIRCALCRIVMSPMSRQRTENA
jgi:hypothetical protein